MSNVPGPTAKPHQGTDVLDELLKEPDVAIDPANLFTMQRLYIACQMEDLGLFQAADLIVERFQNGPPLGKISHDTANALGSYNDHPGWLGDGDRQAMWPRLFGGHANTATVGTGTTGTGTGTGAAGSTGGAAALNANFDSYVKAFVKAVADFQKALATADNKEEVSQSAMILAGRQLADNLSNAVTSGDPINATKLEKQIGTILGVLKDDQIRASYSNSRTSFDVVREVLNQATPPMTKDTRTPAGQAKYGGVVIGYLAKARDVLVQGFGTFIDLTKLAGAPGRLSVKDPAERDLISACEAWQALLGISTTNPPTPNT